MRKRLFLLLLPLLNISALVGSGFNSYKPDSIGIGLYMRQIYESILFVILLMVYLYHECKGEKEHDGI